MALHPNAALAQRLGLGVEALHILQIGLARQTKLDGQNNLRDNLQIAVHKHVQGVRHHPFGRIFHRHHAVIGALFADFGEDVRDGFLGGIKQAGAEFLDGGLMSESGLRPEISDGHRFLEREGAGHDLAVNGAQGIGGDGALVQLANALQDRAFAVGDINRLARLDLDFANLQNVPGALVQQLDDLGVELIDGFAMFRNIHDLARIHNPARLETLPFMAGAR